jgi:hypothetical protein
VPPTAPMAMPMSRYAAGVLGRKKDMGCISRR